MWDSCESNELNNNVKSLTFILDCLVSLDNEIRNKYWDIIFAINKILSPIFECWYEPKKLHINSEEISSIINIANLPIFDDILRIGLVKWRSKWISALDESKLTELYNKFSIIKNDKEADLEVWKTLERVENITKQ